MPREHFLDSISLPMWRERQGQGNDVDRAGDTAGGQKKDLAGLVEAALIMTKVGGPW